MKLIGKAFIPPSRTGGGGGGGGGGRPTRERFTFGGPTSSVTLGMAPTIMLAFRDGVLLDQVGGVPADPGQCRLLGSILSGFFDVPNVLNVYEWA